MTAKLPVSVIIIAKNEEHTIARCVASVSDWASEIIAVINDCTDKTKAILESLGVYVYEHDWQGFIIQKNRAISYTKSPWIFSIDADEEVTPRMLRDITDIVSDPDSKFAAVSFCRKTWLLDRWIKHGDWYPDRVIRLFKKDKAQFHGEYVHEKLIVNGLIKKSRTNLLHYSFPTMYTFLAKNESFTRYFVQINLGKKKFKILPTLFRTFWRFFRGYFIKLGFLDGYPGFIIAIQQSYSTFFKYNMLLENEVKNSKISMENEDL